MQPRGLEGAQRRSDEIRARIDQLRGRTEDSAPFPVPGPTPPATMVGSINQRSNPIPGGMPSGGFAPLDPFGGAARVAESGPTPELRRMIREAAEGAGVDPVLFEALIAAESSFNPRAESPVGAQGLAQLMPGTARMLGLTDPFDPAQNLQGGARYLSQMLQQFGGDERLALAAYNAGPGAVRRHGGVPPFRETQNYIERVLNRANAQR